MTEQNYNLPGTSGLFICLAGFFVGLGCGAVVVANWESTKTEAIERGVARYHPKTGKWEWVVPPVPETPR